MSLQSTEFDFMAGTVRLILAFHNHQPIGNFDGVFEQSYQESYLPFLNVLDDYPDIRFALHTSGSLLEWLEKAHPEYIDRLRAMVSRQQVEIIGGAFYEPILANIPRRDRIGQISSYTRHLESLFHTTVRGMWVPERVWEQSFAGDISAAGIRYTILDDHHFKAGGVPENDLFGYYVTEDEGRLLSVLPGSERLRYLIPFRDPHETISYLKNIAETQDNPVVVFGDDGEKFGTWPDTYKHVYEDRWLGRFLNALRENESWLKVTTPAETLDHVKPRGTCYLPDASYREMTEWALPTDAQTELHRLTHQHRDDDPDWQQLIKFTAGGFWRNFRVKYSESNEMYARAMEISTRIARLEGEQLSDDQRQLLEKARQLLYRGQCNCSYWHGAFGGLYLPHLRNAVYASLIEADGLLEQISRKGDRWVDMLTGDLNLDARQEVRLSNQRLVASFAPACGGHMYELDLRACNTNLLATLNRRPEAYHQKIFQHAERLREASARGEQLHENVSSIHDLVRFKQPDLDRKIVYDRWPRKSLVDHFMTPGLSFDDFRRGEGVVGGFESSTYEASVRRGDTEISVEMRGRGHVNGSAVEVRKFVTISSDRPNELLIQYQLRGLPPGQPVQFGCEFNIATLPGGASDRYFYGPNGSQLGTLDSLQQLDQCDRIGLVDEWQGIDVSLEISDDASLWAFPVETISQSESGFELVHQSVAVVPHWKFTGPESGTWSVEVRLVLDTSLARARQLAALGERRSHETDSAVVESAT
ncbi:MAG: alpha-amylase/4-alpha-glucanotransferase domain-containing protein [Planctomycetaceae bacterium]